ncbi:MAG: hypothetical protein ABI794_15810 [Betaproteobacteria bacterium]
MLKPQDVCLLLKIVARGPEPWSYTQLAWELGMSASEVHAAVRRSAEAGLLRLNEGWGVPDAKGLDELLVYGVRYVWAADRGALVQGMRTAESAPPLVDLLPPSAEPPVVWPDPSGDVRGVALEPLYKSVPIAATRDPVLHELFALVDAIRGGPEAVRTVAIRELRKRLGTDQSGALPKVAASAGPRHAVHQVSSRDNSGKDRDGKERQRVHRGRH